MHQCRPKDLPGTKNASQSHRKRLPKSIKNDICSFQNPVHPPRIIQFQMGQNVRKQSLCELVAVGLWYSNYHCFQHRRTTKITSTTTSVRIGGGRVCEAKCIKNQLVLHVFQNQYSARLGATQVYSKRLVDKTMDLLPN